MTAEPREPVMESNQPSAPLVQLMLSPYDELIEIDVIHGHVRNICHVKGKYFVPIPEAEYTDMFRYSAEHMVHPDDLDVYLRDSNPATLLQHLAESDTPGVIRSRVRYKLLDGGWCWTERVMVGGDTQGVPPGLVYVFVFDIDAKLKDGEEIKSGVPDKDRNQLTGLQRKVSFFYEAKKILRDHPEGWCVIAIDLEQFKLFNEWYGREQGDILLAQIGARLTRTEELSGGLACYMGQDDFALLVPYDKERLQSLYDSIHKLIVDYGTSVGFLPAFGICFAEEGVAIEELYDRAFMASRRAKENYHTRICTFDPSMMEKAEQDYHILSDFQKALKNHELFLMLQPQCHISTERVLGAESLVRWRKADGTMVPPGMFVPVLEQYGFVTDLDEYVWEEVCRWQRKWIDAGHTPLPISVNVSQIDIFTIDVPDYFHKLTEKYHLPTDTIKVEITESAYVDNAKVIDAVQRLRALGFIVLMDDFGSGYSSLNMLRNLNVDIIKLDAQFLRMNGEDQRKGLQIMESIVNMAKTMGVPIIVEGVETKQEVDFLSGLGCRYVQGYYFFRPMPVREFEALISDPAHIDTSGFVFKARDEFRTREFLDENVFSDAMLNNILGPVAFFTSRDGEIEVVRYNQQFYDEIKVSHFRDRIKTLQKLVVKEDLPLLDSLLDQAIRDPLGGARGVIRFNRLDGSVAQFRVRFFFLGEEEAGLKRFYGSVQDVTQFFSLNRHIRLLSQFSPDTVVFLHKPGTELTFQIVANSLQDVLKLDRSTFERELNDGSFRERLDPDERERLLQLIVDSGMQTDDFSFPFSVRLDSGEPVKLQMRFDSVHDKTSDVEYIMLLRRAEG